MKIRISCVLLALVALTFAGFAGAAEQTPAQAPVDDAAVEAPAEGGTIVPAEIDGLFVEPTPMGPCCRFECWSEFEQCRTACGGDTECRQGCRDTYDACLPNC